MSVLVVDASVAAKWFFREEHDELALRLIVSGHVLHAPDFLLAEVGNVLCTRIRRGTLSRVEAHEMFDTLQTVGLHFSPLGDLLDEAFRIAVQTGRSLYDCVYVALAVALDGRMITADRKLFDALAGSPLAEFVAWVEDPL